MSEVDLYRIKHCLTRILVLFHQSACLQAPLLYGPLFQCSEYLQIFFYVFGSWKFSLFFLSPIFSEVAAESHCHRLTSLNSIHLFVIVLGAGSPRSQGIRNGWVLVKSLFLVCCHMTCPWFVPAKSNLVFLSYSNMSSTLLILPKPN